MPSPSSPKIKTTTLERLLVVERERQRADISQGAGFAMPALGERPAEEAWGSLLTTNMRADLVPTRPSTTGVARFGFCSVLPEMETQLLGKLSRILVDRGQVQKDLASAIEWMADRGFAPAHLVLPYSQLSSACSGELSCEEADTIMSSQGYLSIIGDNLRVLVDDVPLGVLVGHPALVGFYIRSNDMLSLLLTRIDAAWCIVRG